MSTRPPRTRGSRRTAQAEFAAAVIEAAEHVATRLLVRRDRLPSSRQSRLTRTRTARFAQRAGSVVIRRVARHLAERLGIPVRRTRRRPCAMPVVPHAPADSASRVLRRLREACDEFACDDPAPTLELVLRILLEREPIVDRATGTIRLRAADPARRRGLGTHYTPADLVERVLDDTLEPVLDRAAQAPDPCAAIASLTVCDPACGSGRFLVAAARRIGRRLAELRTGTNDPSAEAVRAAVRDVVARNLYGIDVEPLAVAACRAILALFAGDPPGPAPHLSRRVRCGNALLGATARDAANGLPDAALRARPGDDARACRALQRRNRAERRECAPVVEVEARRAVEATSPVEAQHAARDAADAWCAAFVWDRRTPHAARCCPTSADVARVASGGLDVLAPQTARRVRRLRARFRFLHWQHVFPEVFPCDDLPSDAGSHLAARGEGPHGFDVVLVNPPYVPGYGRLSVRGSCPFDRLAELSRQSVRRLVGTGPLPGRTNHFVGFVGLAAELVAPHGRAGLVLPDAFLTNASYAPPRRALLDAGRLRSVVSYRAGVFRSATVGTAVVVLGGCADRSADVLLRTVDNLAGTALGTEATMVRTAAALAARPAANWQTAPRADLAAPAGCVPLSDVAHVRDGVNPGPRAVRDRIVVRAQTGPHSRRLLEGADVTPFRIAWSGLWLERDDRLLSRDDRRRGASFRQDWIFERPKIVYRQTATHPVAAVDRTGLHVLNSVHCIVPREDDPVVLSALCAYLNSTPCRLLYQALTGETRSVFPQVHVASMRALPVPARLTDAGDPTTRELARLADESSSADGTGPGPRRASPARIDALVTCLFESSGPP